MPSNVSQTVTRLKGFGSLRAAPGFTPRGDAAALNSALNNLTIVGSLRQIEIIQTRETNGQRWELSQDGIDAMNPAETYPGKSKFSLKIRRADLYTANMLEAFSINSSVITNQITPLVLSLFQPVPEDANGNPLIVNGVISKRRTYIIPGCWFEVMPILYDNEDADMQFIQDVTMNCMAPIVKNL